MALPGGLNPGMPIDVLDYYTGKNTGKWMEKWRAGEVVLVLPDRIKVHYSGWPSSQDTWIFATEFHERLAPFKSKHPGSTPKPRARGVESKAAAAEPPPPPSGSSTSRDPPQRASSASTSSFYAPEVFNEGQLVDVLDYYPGRSSSRPMEKWRIGSIVRFDIENRRVLVHFEGWSSEDDVWLAEAELSTRLAEPYSKSINSKARPRGHHARTLLHLEARGASDSFSKKASEYSGGGGGGGGGSSSQTGPSGPSIDTTAAAAPPQPYGNANAEPARAGRASGAPIPRLIRSQSETPQSTAARSMSARVESPSHSSQHASEAYNVNQAQALLQRLDLEAEAGIHRGHGTAGSKVIHPTIGPLPMGLKVDVLDYYNGRNTGRPMQKWRQGRIEGIHPDGSVDVHFLGWDSSNDTRLEPAEVSYRIAEYQSHSRDSRPKPRVRLPLQPVASVGSGETPAEPPLPPTIPRASLSGLGLGSEAPPALPPRPPPAPKREEGHSPSADADGSQNERIESLLDSQPLSQIIEFCTCPITMELMKDPVIAADGHSYERTAITTWMKVRSTSPVTNIKLPHTHLIGNFALRRICDEIRDAMRESQRTGK